MENKFNLIKEQILTQFNTDLDGFLNESPNKNFYALAFTCNYEYAEILLSLNTEEEFQETLADYQVEYPQTYNKESEILELKYNTGDWENMDISGFYVMTEEEMIERYGDDLEEQIQEMEQFCKEVLTEFCQTDIFKKIPKTENFIAYCIDHDQDVIEAIEEAINLCVL